jgi:hypothetical protein
LENYDYLAVLSLEPATGLYDLFITTYNGKSVTLYPFYCDRKHAMRMDIVSNDLYGTTEFVGSLCQLNNIINPFSVNEGDILFWASPLDLKELMDIPTSLLGQVKSDLVNSMKNRKLDTKRRNYTRTPDRLPPTIMPDNSPQIVVEQDKIKISPNLYRRPASTIVDDTSDEPKDNVVLERVLVNRYIKQIGK